MNGGPAASVLGFPRLRAQLLSEAQGDVLEVAVGTGLNFQHYNSSQITSLTAIDLSNGMLQQAQQKAVQLGLSSQTRTFFRLADVSSLPFEDNSFDSIIDTFGLCVFPDSRAALRSIARVIRPTGRLLLLEHSRSQSPGLGWYQDMTAGPVAAMGKGCVWNQDVPKLLEESGLRMEHAEEYLGGLIVSIVAVKV